MSASYIADVYNKERKTGLSISMCMWASLHVCITYICTLCAHASVSTAYVMIMCLYFVWMYVLTRIAKWGQSENHRRPSVQATQQTLPLPLLSAAFPFAPCDRYISQTDRASWFGLVRLWDALVAASLFFPAELVLWILSRSSRSVPLRISMARVSLSFQWSYLVRHGLSLWPHCSVAIAIITFCKFNRFLLLYFWVVICFSIEKSLKDIKVKNKFGYNVNIIIELSLWIY